MQPDTYKKLLGTFRHAVRCEDSIGADALLQVYPWLKKHIKPPWYEKPIWWVDDPCSADTRWRLHEHKAEKKRTAIRNWRLYSGEWED